MRVGVQRIHNWQTVNMRAHRTCLALCKHGHSPSTHAHLEQKRMFFYHFGLLFAAKRYGDVLESNESNKEQIIDMPIKTHSTNDTFISCYFVISAAITMQMKDETASRARAREPKNNENCANSMSAHRIMAGEWLQCRLGLCAVLNSRSRCFCHKYNLSVDECNLHPYDHRSVLSRSRTTQIILGNCASVSEKIYRRIELPAPTRYTLCGEPHDDSKMYEHHIFGFECCVG